MKVAIIGKGNVGKALGEGLTKAGHEIKYGHRDLNEPVDKAVAWGEVIILAIPWTAHKDFSKEAGNNLNGKIIIDVSNILTPSYELALGFDTSGAEELQKLIHNAKVIKAFNTVFAQNMRTGKIGKESLTIFIAGDDKKAKETASKLAKDIGFEIVDAGQLKSARYLEPMGILNITLGYGLKMGTDIGIRLVQKK